MRMPNRSGLQLHSHVLIGLAALPLVLNTASVPVGNVAEVTSSPGAQESSVTAAATPPPSAPPVLLAPPEPQMEYDPGIVKVASPDPGESWRASAPGQHDIPWTALQAYQRAARILAEVDADCRLPWTLLAAVGRVESNHGRFAGATLGVDGVSEPLIIGVPLDGEGPVAAIRDSDAGEYDGDKTWDRAVGPMQFIPTTWAVVGVDADGDDVRNPNDIDDAALAAAVYLCAGASGLDEPDGMRTAVYRYNHSSSYVDLVLSIERGYRTGDFRVLESPQPGVARLAELKYGEGTLTLAGDEAEKAIRKDRRQRANGNDPAEQQAKAGASPQGSKLGNPAPSAPGSPSGTPSDSPSETPSDDPSGTPSGDPSGTPSDDSSGRASVTGMLTRNEEGVFWLDDTALEVGSTAQKTSEELAAELSTFVGKSVTVEVDQSTGSWVVYSVTAA